MKTNVIDRNGVVLAGPDKAALAPEGSVVVMAPVGGVSPAQAGILDYAPRLADAQLAGLSAQKNETRIEGGHITADRITTGGLLVVSGVSDEMIDRAHAAAPGFDREMIERILRAGLGLA